jgi:aryl-alcohol dehydrogenase-like predicted oxidoreductase
VLTGKYLKKENGRVEEDNPRRNEKNTTIAEKVVEIAEKLSATPGQVALKWMLQLDASYIPIIGATKAGQLKDSLGCLAIEIPGEMMKELDELTSVDLGFPHDFLNDRRIRDIIFGGTYDKMRF